MVLTAEIVEIQKRDGRIVAFDRTKIVAAIMRAAQAVQGSDYRLADELSADVLTRVRAESAGKLPTVETIQDAIEKVLIEHGHARTAKAFILYRARRSRIREGKSELMDAVAEILDEPLDRPNALPRARRVAIGIAASREFVLNRLLPEAMADAHLLGEIHLHGLADYAQAPHAVAVPLRRMLQQGFSSGYGFMRPPRRAGSAAALAHVILQAAQGDCSGPQGVAAFDADLAAVLPAGTTAEDLDQAMESLVYNLNTLAAQGGEHLPYASLQVGLDTSELGRAVTRALLGAAGRGLGHAEPALRPHLVFRLQAGVNLAAGDPNFDLTREALALAASRLLVTFVHDEADAAYAGHSARLNGVTGQLARSTINLPRIALTARREGTDFQAALEATIRKAVQGLEHRAGVLGARPVSDFPFMQAQGLAPGDGQLVVGVMGLAQALTVLSGQHHGASPSSQAEGLNHMRHAAALVTELAASTGRRLVLQAVDADHVGARFARLDRREFGLIKGVTEIGGYGQGVSLPLDVDFAERCALEGAYANLFEGGCVMRDALPEAPTPEVLLERLQLAVAHGVRAYVADFPLAAKVGGSERAVERRSGFLELA